MSGAAAYTHILYCLYAVLRNERKPKVKNRVIINPEPRGRFDSIICGRKIIIKKISPILVQCEFRFQNADVLE